MSDPIQKVAYKRNKNARRLLNAAIRLENHAKMLRGAGCPTSAKGAESDARFLRDLAAVDFSETAPAPAESECLLNKRGYCVTHGVMVTEAEWPQRICRIGKKADAARELK